MAFRIRFNLDIFFITDLFLANSYLGERWDIFCVFSLSSFYFLPLFHYLIQMVSESQKPNLSLNLKCIYLPILVLIITSSLC